MSGYELTLPKIRGDKCANFKFNKIKHLNFNLISKFREMFVLEEYIF